VLVVRVRPNGQLAMAKPCAHCATALWSFGVRRVRWSTDFGTIDELRG
jgi:hypothetical protein